MQRQFKLKPSSYLAVLLMGAHGATLATLFFLPFPLWSKGALAMLVLLSLTYHLRYAAWLSVPSACVGLMLENDQITLTTRGGEQLAGHVLRDSLVTPFLTVLNVLPQGQRIARNVIILPDSLDAESFRQLRVYLKWGMSD